MSQITNFKQKKIRDKAHLKFIRTCPCIKCFQAPSQACHLRYGSNAGMGQKPSDSKCLPMCAVHHFQQHQMPENEFHGDIDKAHELADYLYEHTGRWRECVLRIREYISLNQRRT